MKSISTPVIEGSRLVDKTAQIMPDGTIVTYWKPTQDELDVLGLGEAIRVDVRQLPGDQVWIKVDVTTEELS